MANQEIFDKLTNAIVTQNVAGCAQLAQEALAAGIAPLDIITKGLSPGMKIIGDKFEAARITSYNVCYTKLLRETGS